jgi:hypothetical protein
MELPFWSDKDRLFVYWGLGASLNFKFVAKKMGLVKAASPLQEPEVIPSAEARTQTDRDRLRDRIENSKYEQK